MPSTSTVQAPQTPCSHPACAPLSEKFVAQAVEQAGARFDLDGMCLLVDVELDLHERLAADS